jgi:hypothetical protein
MVCAILMVATLAASSANQTQTESELDQSKDIHSSKKEIVGTF